MRVVVLLTCLCVAGCAAPSAESAQTESLAFAEQNVEGDDVRARWVREGEWLVSSALQTDGPATRVALLSASRGALVARAAPRFEVQGDDGRWQPLQPVDAESDWTTARADLAPTFRARLRVRAEDTRLLNGLTWSLLEPPAQSELEPEPEVSSRTEALRAEFAALGVVSRADWGAAAGRGCEANPTKDKIAIHHTVTPSSGSLPSRVRGIQSYHQGTQGWCDVGYHFLVGQDGSAYEGRPVEQLGTHVGGNNTGNVGISFIGCFHTSGCSDWTPFQPSQASSAAAGRLAREVARIYAIPITPATLKGHRDHPGQTTSCPGDNLHARLGDIRALAGSSGGPRFGAQVVTQSWPIASVGLPLAPGADAPGFIELRNTGTETWTPGATFLGTTQPRDRTSVTRGPDWVSGSRAATVDRSVPTGQTGRFAFTFRAPPAAGEYREFFTLVQEGVAWFSDPGQGGPADDYIQVRLIVSGAPPDAGLPAPRDAGGAPADSGPVTIADASLADAGSPSLTDATIGRDGAVAQPLQGGCTCRSGAGAALPPLGTSIAACLLLGLLRRRSRSAGVIAVAKGTRRVKPIADAAPALEAREADLVALPRVRSAMRE